MNNIKINPELALRLLKSRMDWQSNDHSRELVHKEVFERGGLQLAPGCLLIYLGLECAFYLIYHDKTCVESAIQGFASLSDIFPPSNQTELSVCDKMIAEHTELAENFGALALAELASPYDFSKDEPMSAERLEELQSCRLQSLIRASMHNSRICMALRGQFPAQFDLHYQSQTQDERDLLAAELEEFDDDDDFIPQETFYDRNMAFARLREIIIDFPQSFIDVRPMTELKSFQPEVTA